MAFLLTVLVFIVVATPIASAGNLRGLNADCAEFCSKVTVTLIDIDAMSGSFSTLVTILPEMSSADAKQLRPYLAVDLASNVTLVVIDNLSTTTAQLFVYSETANNITNKVSFGDSYQKQALTSLFFDSNGRRLLATFGNQLVSIDTLTAAITPVLTMYDSTKFEIAPATVSLYDPLSNRYLTSALEAVDMECVYLFAANLTDSSIKQSACIPNPATTPNAMFPTQLQPYNGTALLSVWLNPQSGMSIDLVEPISEQMSEVFSNADFNRAGWFMGNYNPMAYDHAANVIWMYIFDGKHYRFARLDINGQYTLGGETKLPNVLNTVLSG